MQLTGPNPRRPFADFDESDSTAVDKPTKLPQRNSQRVRRLGERAERLDRADVTGGSHRPRRANHHRHRRGQTGLAGNTFTCRGRSHGHVEFKLGGVHAVRVQPLAASAQSSAPTEFPVAILRRASIRVSALDRAQAKNSRLGFRSTCARVWLEDARPYGVHSFLSHSKTAPRCRRRPRRKSTPNGPILAAAEPQFPWSERGGSAAPRGYPPPRKAGRSPPPPAPSSGQPIARKQWHAHVLARVFAGPLLRSSRAPSRAAFSAPFGWRRAEFVRFGPQFDACKTLEYGACHRPLRSRPELGSHSRRRAHTSFPSDRLSRS